MSCVLHVVKTSWTYNVTISILLLFIALKSRIAPTAKSLAAGTRQIRPAHIPAHLPPLPDPHSYIKTPVSHLFKDWKFNFKEPLSTGSSKHYYSRKYSILALHTITFKL